jgi:hypothetical protein
MYTFLSEKITANAIAFSTPLWHVYDVLPHHILPILLKKRVAAP